MKHGGVAVMVKQVFDVEGYWEVVVWYDMDYHFFGMVEDELRVIGFSEEDIKLLYDVMREWEAKAVTCSNTKMKKSIVIFNRHDNYVDYINSIVHEAEHVKQAMLKGYGVKDEGEEPAYTIGYLVGRMWKVFHPYVSYIFY